MASPVLPCWRRWSVLCEAHGGAKSMGVLRLGCGCGGGGVCVICLVDPGAGVWSMVVSFQVCGPCVAVTA